jgi:hypothetical protein
VPRVCIDRDASGVDWTWQGRTACTRDGVLSDGVKRLEFRSRLGHLAERDARVAGLGFLRGKWKSDASGGEGGQS